jgi:hypothetical protein
VPFRVLLFVVDAGRGLTPAGVRPKLLANLGASLFDVFVQVDFCTRNECG